MRYLKAILKFLLVIGLIVGLAVGVIYYFLGTEKGFQTIWSMAEKYMPEQLQVGRVRGTFLSHLDIENLNYHDAENTVSIKSIKLDWNVKGFIRYYLLHGQHALDVSHLPMIVSSLHITRAVIQEAHVKIAGAKFDVDGALDHEWEMKWSATIPDFSKFSPDVRGKLIGSGVITGKINQLLKFNGKFFINGLMIDAVAIPNFNVALNGQLKGKAFAQTLKIVFSPANSIDAEMRIPNFSLANALEQRFYASAKVRVNNFSQFKFLLADVPQVKSVNGEISGFFTANGKLTQPIIEGSLQTANASLTIPDAGMRLSSIKLLASYHSGRKVNLSGSFSTGKGTIALAGTYGIEEPALPLNVNFRGNEVIAMDTKEYVVKVSPDITVAYRNHDLNIDGKVVIPYARIRPIDLSSTSTLPNDVVIVNRHSATVDVPTNFTLHVEVMLGDQVKVKTHGLNAYLQGSIKITGLPGNPLTAAGQFSIQKNGTYRAYGRILNIDQGRLIYAGNLLSNPGISLRATQTIKRVGFANGSSQFGTSDLSPVYSGANNLVVGVDVNGMLKKPRVTLFSEPAGLSQGDILSYLLLGYPQSQVSTASSLALLNVASEMYGGSNKKNVVNNLQKSLGLDELSVGSTEYYNANQEINPNGANGNGVHSATTVNLGRNLGHNLSLHYSMGLFQQVQVFNLRYQMTKYFALQTETSTLENGGDILYQLESDN